MIDFEKIIKDNISNCGWHMFHISADKKKGIPAFFYTIGLTELNMPELLLVGALNPQSAQTIFYNIIESWKSNGVTEGITLDFAEDRFGNDLPMLISPLQISSTLKDDFAVQAFHYYKKSQDRVRVSQIIWSDEKGRFPSDKDFSMHDLTMVLPAKSSTFDA